MSAKYTALPVVGYGGEVGRLVKWISTGPAIKVFEQVILAASRAEDKGWQLEVVPKRHGCAYAYVGVWAQAPSVKKWRIWVGTIQYACRKQSLSGPVLLELVKKLNYLADNEKTIV